jgi:hypothetical protein
MSLGVIRELVDKFHQPSALIARDLPFKAGDDVDLLVMRTGYVLYIKVVDCDFWT